MVIVWLKCRDLKNNISHLFSETNIVFAFFVFCFVLFCFYLLFFCIVLFCFSSSSSADYNVLEKF